MGDIGTPELRTRWRWGIHSLATWQVRHIMFSGTGSLIVQGSGDVVATNPRSGDAKHIGRLSRAARWSVTAGREASATAAHVLAAGLDVGSDGDLLHGRFSRAQRLASVAAREGVTRTGLDAGSDLLHVMTPIRCRCPCGCPP